MTHSMILFQLSNESLPIIIAVVYTIDSSHVCIELNPSVTASRLQRESY